MEVFVKPKVTFSYEEILLGTNVNKPSGVVEQMRAIDNDVWKAFHHIDNPSGIFKNYLSQNKKTILDKLSKIKSESELDNLENLLLKEIKSQLEKYKMASYNPKTLDSYNRMRQPIDLFIENIVSMSKELEGQRGAIVKYMFLPLGKQIFSNGFLFSEGDRNIYKLKSESAFGDLILQSDYKKIQDKMNLLAQRVSQETGKIFYRVFLDLLWKDKYKNQGNNLFELIPDKDN